MGFFSKIFKKKQENCVGVDIGTSGIKAVELSRSADERLVLKNYVMAQGDHFIRPGSPGVLDSQAGEALRRIFEKAKIENRKINISVPSFASLITTIEIPQMPEEKVGAVIAEEASKYIPVKLDDVVYGWEVIDDFSGGEKGSDLQKDPSKKSAPVSRMKVLMVAIMKEISGYYEKVLSKSGFTIDSLEVDSFSLARSLAANPGRCQVVLDIGHKVCTMIIVLNKNILVSRSIDVAGEKITKVISQGIGVGFQRAEALKLEKSQSGAFENMEFLNPTYNVISTEVRKTINIFRENYPNLSVDKILLAGGASQTVGLSSFLKKVMEVEVEVLNPFSDILVPENLKSRLVQRGCFFPVSIGLARLGFEKKV